MSKAIFGRQSPAFFIADCGPANMGAGNGFTVAIPPGAVFASLVALTTTGFDSETTATLTVSDGTTTFVNGVDIKSTGSETVANVPKFYPSGGTLTISLAQTGDGATTGRALVYGSFVGVNRVTEGP
jgi:hypothetical protein